MIGYAVRSVLDQTFGDFEIVIVDNDDTDATFQVIRQFDDPRLRYFRTGGLSMSDNWDYGCRQARGEYLNVQADKHVLKKRALERIYQVVERQRHEIVSWRNDVFNDLGDRGYLIRAKRTGQERFISIGEIVTTFLTQTHARTQHLTPRGYNSATHRLVINKIAERSPNHLILPVSPDYTLCFAQLAFCDGTLHIDESLFVAAIRDSNGRLFKLKDISTHSYIEDVGAQMIYDRVLIKSPTIICSGIFNDFLRARHVFKGNLTPYELDPTTYFVLCYEEVLERASTGVDMTEELEAIQAALLLQPRNIQTAFGKNVRTLRFESILENIKKQAYRIASTRKKYKIRRESNATSQNSARQLPFDNILEAARADDT